jgi:VCBS repeat-containing protein
VRVFSGADRREMASFLAFEPSFAGGVFVAATNVLPLVFTSANAAAFTEGSSGSFAVTTSNGAGATLSVDGTLPSGVTFSSTGEGTALLAGTPEAGTAGTYTLQFVATRGAVRVATQSFTLTVESAGAGGGGVPEPPTPPSGIAPAITSGDSATFAIGTAGSFTFQATGSPAPALALIGVPPAGLTFTDNGDGSGTLAGTPTDFTAGTYALQVSATNGIGAPAVQAFVLTVTDVATASISTADAATFVVGAPNVFLVGMQRNTVASVGINPPTPMQFQDQPGSGLSVLMTATPAAGAAGTYAVSLTASGATPPPATQTLTLGVVDPRGAAPTIPSINTTTFVTGVANTFTLVATGTPAPVLTWSGTTPPGVNFVDNGNGTATLAGVSASPGVHQLTITASNPSGTFTQRFTLIVKNVEATPTFTTPAAAIFTVGTAGSFSIAAQAASAVTQISQTGGTLPAGLALTSNPDGTATIAGMPQAGTAGLHALTVEATDGAATPATQQQNLRIIVHEAPAITSAGNATFVVASAGTFTIAATGMPMPVAAVAGALPAGVTFTDNHDGTATLSGTPTDPGPYPLTFPLTVTAVNGVGTTATQTFTLSVTDNLPPTLDAIADPAPIAEDSGLQTVNFAGVSAGGAETQDLAVTAASDNTALVPHPAVSYISPNATGSLSYTPVANASGTATITVTVRDAGVNGSLGDADDGTFVRTFLVTVTAENDAPTAADDTFGVAEGGTLTQPAPGVLANDADAEASPLSAILVSGPTHASSFTLNADGSFSYTHDGGETTPDTFTYRANDGTADSNLATVTIDISPVNDAPAAVNDSVTTDEDTILNLPAPGVMANDIDPDPGDTRTVVEVNGQAASVGTPIATAKGASLTMNADGSLTYDPRPVFQHLDPGDPAETDTFTYTIQDASGATSSATVTITVNGVNDAPVVDAGAAAVTFTEDGPAVVVAAALTVTDVDDTDLSSATVTITNPLDGALETLAATTAGTAIAVSFDAVTLTLTLSNVDTLANYQQVLRSVTYSNSSQNPNTTVRSLSFQANDGQASSTASIASVAIVAVPDAPVVTSNAALVFTEGNPATVIDAALTVTDADDSALESATVQITGNYQAGEDVLASAAVAGITAVFNPLTGTLSLTGSATLAQYQTALRSVTYFNGSQNPSPLPRTVAWIVNDGDGNSAPAISTITVIPVNDAPVVLNETFQSIGNTELRVDLAAGTTPNVTHTTTGVTSLKGVLDNDGDVEGDPFLITAIGGCSDTTAPFDCTLADGAVIHVEGSGEFSYVPAAGATAGSFAYTVTDNPPVGVPASASGTVTVNLLEMVWYVDADAEVNGDGRSTSPFDSFASLNGAGGSGDTDDNDDYIFLHAATDPIVGGIELEAGQRLVGEAAGLSINQALNDNPAPVSLVGAAGTPPTINGGGGNAVTATASLPAEIKGLTLSGLNAVDLTSAGALSGTVLIQSNVIAGTGAEGIDVNLNAGASGTLTLAISNNTWTGASVGNAVDVNRAAGTLSLALDANTNITTSAIAIAVTGGSAASTTIAGFAGNSVLSAAAGVSVSNATFANVAGGTLALGSSINRLTGTGMVLTGVQGALAFTDLDVFATSNGLTIAGGGSGMTFSVAAAAPDGAGTSTLNVSNGPAVDVSNTTLDLRLAGLVSTTSASGVALSNVAGTFRAPAGSSITKSGIGAAVDVDSGTAAIVYNGTINASGGRPVEITNRTGAGAGAVTFGGAITGSSQGILLDNNDTSPITFSGGLSLTTGANPAFTATNGGTVVATETGGPNVLTTTTATALNVTNTSIGAAGLTFRSISAGTAVGSAGNGIVLDNTGLAAGNGGLTVTGLSGAASGGTIQHKTGVNGATTGGIGIYLNNTKDVSLNLMQLNDFDNHGIRGNGVSGFRMTNSIISGLNGTEANGTTQESSINFSNVTGTATLSGNTISGGFFANVYYDNSSGTTNLNVLNNTIQNTNAAFTGDGFLLEADTTATILANVSGNTFTANGGDHFNMSLVNNANVDLTFNNNDLNGGHPAALGQGLFILGAAYNGTFKYDITGNDVQGNVQGGAIFVNKGSGTGTFSGQIVNNVVGTAAIVGSGSAQAVGIHASARGAGGSHTTLITGNTVRQYFDRGIVLEAGEGAPTFVATVANNTVDNFADALNSLHGIHFDFGILAADNAQITIDVRDNLIANAANEVQGGSDFRMRTAGSNDVFIAGYTGGNNSANAQAFIDAQNPDGTTFLVTLAGSGTYNNGPSSPLPTPTLPTLPPSP